MQIVAAEIEAASRVRNAGSFSAKYKKKKNEKQNRISTFARPSSPPRNLTLAKLFQDLNPIPMNLPESIFEDEHPVAVILSPWARENGILKLLSGGV
ncbi:hypothetical protein CEXT_12901 [Caerostris extrusa]|uniref:Uncharacterized protein n=1 Tax=Caerostris extrusa TaxID=172846 RepID=A0AAV4XI60_CAEEX|nr:hypothetical protein CEXT_12901 [Caerostris extrusa]